MLKKAAYHYPFTIAGTLLLVVAVYLLGTAFAANNIYAFTASAVAFIILIVSAVAAKIQAFRMSQLPVSWDTSHPLIARLNGCEQTIHIGEGKPFYFFRIHFIIKGKLVSGRDASLNFRAEGSASNGGALRIPLYFPVCGILDINGRLAVRDMFGFVVARFKDEERRKLPVRAPLFPVDVPARIETLLNSESKQNRQKSDDDKYYMREYQAGDRLKDINWKSSYRLQELITKVSPISPEHSMLLHVEFRCYSSMPSDDLESLIHLNYAKSWLLSFLTAMLRSYPELKFRILTPYGADMIESSDDIDKYSVRLAAIPFTSSQRENENDLSIKERFIFTTMYDAALPHYLYHSNGIKNHIFRTVNKKTKNRVRQISFFNTEHWEVLPSAKLIYKHRFHNNRTVNVGDLGGGKVYEESLRVKWI